MDASLRFIRWLLAHPERSFTVREAAEGADVNAQALRSFIERRRHLFVVTGRDETGRPGGQPVRYLLSPAEVAGLRAWVEPEADEPVVEGLPSGLVAALDQLITSFPKADSRKERRETLELARRSIAEDPLPETPRVKALQQAYENLLQLCDMESDGVGSAARLQPAMVSCMQELVDVGESDWSAQLGLRFLTSPLNARHDQPRTARRSERALLDEIFGQNQPVREEYAVRRIVEPAEEASTDGDEFPRAVDFPAQYPLEALVESGQSAAPRPFIEMSRTKESVRVARETRRPHQEFLASAAVATTEPAVIPLEVEADETSSYAMNAVASSVDSNSDIAIDDRDEEEDIDAFVYALRTIVPEVGHEELRRTLFELQNISRSREIETRLQQLTIRQSLGLVDVAVQDASTTGPRKPN